MTDPRQLPVPESWAGILNRWATQLTSEACSPQTIATRLDHMRRISRAMGCQPDQVTADQLISWCGDQTWARETRRSVYTSARKFWRWFISTPAGSGVVSPADSLPHVRATDPAPRPAPAVVIQTGLIDADPRTALILRCAVDAGMRRGEIAQIHARDLTRDLTGWSITVHGKGQRERTIPLPDDLATDLRQACKTGGGWAFPGRIGGHLSARRVGELATDVLPGIWTLHTLRHAYATRLHDATHDLIAVQQLLGHASVATTQRYVATDRDRLRRAITAGARAA